MTIDQFYLYALAASGAAFSLRLVKSKFFARFQKIAPLFLILLFIIFLRNFIFASYHIPTTSMEPLLTKGDYVWVTKFDYSLRTPFSNDFVHVHTEPRKGDIIAFLSPDDRETLFVKRVIGKAGDTVSYTNKELFINGVKVDSEITIDESTYTETNNHASYQIQIDQKYINSKAEGSWVVPDQHLFVMGDNRDHSRDSRFFGPVNLDDVVGRVRDM